MKKGFSLIEIIIVIVIIGILSSITFDVLKKLYFNYIYTQELNKLNSNLNMAMEVISAKLKDRIKNSVIVTKYPSNTDQTDDNKVDFKPISQAKKDDGYIVLEWINKDYEAKNGMWDNRVKHIQTGWSGFIDLGYKSHKVNINPKEFNLTTPDSNFSIVKLIDGNITSAYGDSSNIFEDNTTILIFSGANLSGDIVEDLNHSYGWYLKPSQREAKAVFAILKYKDYIKDNNLYTDIKISSITKNDKTNTLYSRYYLARSAYAIVPIKNDTNDYNLTFVYNYQPWQGEWWRDGNKTLLATNVTQIRFKKENSIMRLYLCMRKVFKDFNVTSCKEKAIF